MDALQVEESSKGIFDAGSLLGQQYSLKILLRNISNPDAISQQLTESTSHHVHPRETNKNAAPLSNYTEGPEDVTQATPKDEDGLHFMFYFNAIHGDWIDYPNLLPVVLAIDQ